MNHSGPVNYLFGGWVISSSMKFTSGMPLYFWDSSVCGVPSQFRAACIPAINGKVLAQSWGSMDVNRPAYNASAFEPSSSVNTDESRGVAKLEPARGAHSIP